ncbi:MAG TPA: class I mannose-6-phosphate isomerase [Sphingopyxis sp.]|uniref:class I mannose-6-phosphate isomerase n=1 Tax=Sphingopyxis sp. TaxID=1908224 RepID=UPI002C63BD60|nr:class I mannose-6-phosphate isomerase [Sphingopyxis sp.]HWW59380.1 class I mannose-6-phosphate isomerase [Sphingopyxis sp.]
MPATLLAAHRVEKPWGRRRLRAPFDDSPASGEPTGEIWFHTPGDSAPDLLIKYIFTSEKLSVQVHPDDARAHARGLARGKDECWLILDAEPGAAIALGTKAPVGEAVLRDAALDGRIEQLLDWKPVRTGDFFYVPSGTVHAIGAGLTLIEVQQNSETTYRLYDYGRPRELHLDDGIAAADARPYERYPSPGRVDAGRALLVEGPKFVLERLGGGARTLELPDAVTAWLVPVAGKGLVDGVAFEAGECLALTGSVQLAAEPDADLLLAYPGEKRCR